MPVHNCEKFISEAMESLYQQTHPIRKIYVLDDASDDDTISIIQNSQQAHVEIISSSTQQGIVHQLNKGIKLSTADYIARMDGDDVCFPDRVEHQVKFLDNNPDHVACAGGFFDITEAGEHINEIHLSNAPDNPLAVPAYQKFLKHPFLMVRSSSIKSIDGYNDIHHCEDADLYYRLSEFGALHNLPDLLGKYRIHNASISSQSASNNKLQALHSQLTALHLARGEHYVYPEANAQQLKDYFIQKQPSLENAINFSSETYHLTDTEQQWLSVAFPIKFLENIKLREIQLTEQDLALYVKLLPLLLKNSKYTNLRNLGLIFRSLKANKQSSCVKKNKLKILFYRLQYNRLRNVRPRN